MKSFKMISTHFTAGQIETGPDKCKVLSISNRASESSTLSMLPFQIFIYTLNGDDLKFVLSEKDL